MSETELSVKLAGKTCKRGWQAVKADSAVYGFQDERQFMRSLWTPELKQAALPLDAEGLLQAEALAEGFVASGSERTVDEFCECVAEILVRRSKKQLQRLRRSPVDEDMFTLHAPILKLAVMPLSTMKHLSTEVNIGLERLQLSSEADLIDSEFYIFVASLSYALEAAWHYEPLPVSTGVSRMDELFAELSAMMLEFSLPKPQAQERLRRIRVTMELKRRYQGPTDRFPVSTPYPALTEYDRHFTEVMDDRVIELYFKAAYGDRP